MHFLLNSSHFLRILLLDLLHSLCYYLLTIRNDHTVSKFQILSVLLEFFPHFFLIVKNKHIVFFLKFALYCLAFLFPALSDILHILFHFLYSFLVHLYLHLTGLLQLNVFVIYFSTFLLELRFHMKESLLKIEFVLFYFFPLLFQNIILIL